MSVASSVTAQHLHRQRSPSLHYQSISLVASGNLLFMGSILIFKPHVFIHGHHIFSMLTSYSQLAWNFLSSLDKWGPSVFNIYYLTRDTGTMFKLYLKVKYLKSHFWFKNTKITIC